MLCRDEWTERFLDFQIALLEISIDALDVDSQRLYEIQNTSFSISYRRCSRTVFIYCLFKTFHNKQITHALA